MEAAHLLLRAASADGHSANIRRWRMRLRSLPQRLRWMPRVLPDVLAAALAYRRAPLRRWTASAGHSLSSAEAANIMSAVHWWTRLLYPRQSRVGTCLLRAYAAYRAFRRRGHPVFFVSTPQGLSGHAWLEEERGVPAWYGEPLVRLRYKEQFRWPAR